MMKKIFSIIFTGLCMISVAQGKATSTWLKVDPRPSKFNYTFYFYSYIQ